jgi:hypothetical protein
MTHTWHHERTMNPPEWLKVKGKNGQRQEVELEKKTLGEPQESSSKVTETYLRKQQSYSW